MHQPQQQVPTPCTRSLSAWPAWGGVWSRLEGDKHHPKDTDATCIEKKAGNDFTKSPRPCRFLLAELQQNNFNQSDLKFRLVKLASLRFRSCSLP